jgi:hypothetical protein
MTDPVLWLSTAAAKPATFLCEWRTKGVIELPIGVKWDVVEVELPFSRKAARELKALKEHIGGRLVSGAERRVWWLLPLRSGRLFDEVPGAMVLEAGESLLAPLPGRYDAERAWIFPEEVQQLTEPTALRDALWAVTADAWPTGGSHEGH